MKKGRQRLLTFSKRRWFRPEIQGDEGILPLLPDEILLMILRHLDIKQLGVLSSVAKRLHEASYFDELWRPIFHRQFSEWLTCEELTSRYFAIFYDTSPWQRKSRKVRHRGKIKWRVAYLSKANGQITRQLSKMKMARKDMTFFSRRHLLTWYLRVILSPW